MVLKYIYITAHLYNASNYTKVIVNATLIVQECGSTNEFSVKVYPLY